MSIVGVFSGIGSTLALSDDIETFSVLGLIPVISPGVPNCCLLQGDVPGFAACRSTS